MLYLFLSAALYICISFYSCLLELMSWYPSISILYNFNFNKRYTFFTKMSIIIISSIHRCNRKPLGVSLPFFQFNQGCAAFISTACIAFPLQCFSYLWHCFYWNLFLFYWDFIVKQNNVYHIIGIFFIVTISQLVCSI